MSRVSVIIAAYNYGKYLPDALRSLQNQTFADWECIVVNDGSTDDTDKVARSFAASDPRIIYVQQANQGVSAARNTGLAMAKAEFIQFLDADDMLQKAKLETQVKYLEKNSGCSLVCSDFIHVRDVSGMNENRGELPAEYKRTIPAQECLEILLRGNFIRINTVLLRKSVIEKTGTFHSALRSVEDWDFWIRCVASGYDLHFVSADNAHAVIRESSAGLSKDVKTMKQHYVAVLQRLYYSGNVSGLLGFKVLLRASFHACVFWLSNQPTQYDEENKSGFRTWVILLGVILFPVALVYRLFR